MSKQKWSFKHTSSALGDTGDYNSSIIFTNGSQTLESSGDDIEAEDCERFCELLNMMPDLWSLNVDKAEFELSLMKKRSEHYEKALKQIKEASYSNGEIDKEKIDDLKAIAFNALYEIENGLF